MIHNSLFAPKVPRRFLFSPVEVYDPCHIWYIAGHDMLGSELAGFCALEIREDCAVYVVRYFMAVCTD